MATKKGFLLLNNQIEIIETLTDEQAGQLLKAFYDYNLGKEIKLNGLMLTVFNNFKVVFDENEQKYQEKCEKNKQNIENYWKKIKEQNTNEYERIQSNTNVYEKIRTNTMATNININTNKNINTNTNLNINENININKKNNNNISLVELSPRPDPDISDDLVFSSSHPDEENEKIGVICKEVISRLNELTGSNFKSNADTNKRLIKALLKDYTKEDILMVVDKMCYKWMQPQKSGKDMSEYLRPSTLFRRSNFDNYYGLKIQEKEITTKDIAEQMDFSEFR